MKKAIAISHVCFEDAGTLEDLLTARGMSFRYLQAGVDDLSSGQGRRHPRRARRPDRRLRVDRYPFLKTEFAVIETAMGRGKPVDRHLPRLPGSSPRCSAPASIPASRRRSVGMDRANAGGRKSSPLARHRERARAALAWRYFRSAARRDPARLDRDHAEPGLHLRRQGARAAVPCGAAPAGYGAMADRPYPRACHFQGRSRQAPRRHRALCAGRQAASQSLFNDWLDGAAN